MDREAIKQQQQQQLMRDSWSDYATTVETADDKDDDMGETQPTVEELSAIIEQLKIQVNISKFSVERFAGSDDDIFFYTGFATYSSFKAFWEFVKPSADSLAIWRFTQVRGDREKERNRNRLIQPIDQLWMFLTRARLGLFERDLAVRFNISPSSVSDTLITWRNYLYIMLGSLPTWVSKEKIKQNLPESFKGQYQNVRGTFDCTELKCDTAKDYQTHSEMYSDYKSHDTYKGFICISPNC